MWNDGSLVAIVKVLPLIPGSLLPCSVVATLSELEKLHVRDAGAKERTRVAAATIASLPRYNVHNLGLLFHYIPLCLVMSTFERNKLHPLSNPDLRCCLPCLVERVEQTCTEWSASCTLCLH